MLKRWLVVAVAAAVLVATPLVVAARPVTTTDIGAAELADRIGASADRGWSGYVETAGSLQLPDSDSFATLGTLLGEQSSLRVWWRGAEDWRVDRIRGTGETDLFRDGDALIRWVFESEQAVYSPVSDIRLPDASDLLPPSLARTVLQGASDDELTRLPDRRVAGFDLPGVRLTSDNEDGTVGSVDIWADADTGLALAVEVTPRGADRPVIISVARQADLTAPTAAQTDYVPSAQTRLDYEPAIDVAAAASALQVADLPEELGGLSARPGREPGPVGVYGRGPTGVIVVPLRGRVSEPLRNQLLSSATASQTRAGTQATIGPITVLLTGFRYGRGRGAYLIAGTVTPAAAQRIATDVLAAAR